jgi:Tfp pilus assembly protein PilN
MIRVNLLKNFSGATVSPTGTIAPSATSIETFEVRGDGFTPDLLVKCALLVVPLILIISFDYYEINQRQYTLATATSELAQAKQKLESLKPQVEAVTKFKENKKQLQTKIDVIRNISKERLKNVKALDALQSIIPAKVWLNKLTLKDNHVTMDGSAIEDSDVATFMQGLEESVFFAGVILKSVESEKSKEGVYKKFSLEMNLENM